jgi:hypothetical protein
VRSLGDETLARELYGELYGEATPGVRLVDGSTSNAMRPKHPHVAYLAAAIAASASIVYLVRNPVDRAISHYRHLRAWDMTEDPDFALAVVRNASLIDFGRYWWQLEPWLSVFGHKDAAELASLLGRAAPLWNWEATRRRFE